MIGVPVPEIIQFLLPALSVVAAVSPASPIVSVEAVMLPEPPVWVVTVSPPAVEFENISVENVQLFVPLVVPKFLAAAILCSNVPPVIFTVPVPTALPFTVTFEVPLVVPLLVISFATVIAEATVVEPETVRLY